MKKPAKTVPLKTTPKRPDHPREKFGWNLMVLGLLILLTAGVMYYMMPNEEPVYRGIGNYLMGLGLAVYIAGRIIRAKGRRLREQGEAK